MRLLSEADKTEIAEAIKKAESATTGEIVFAVTDASARYRQAAFLGALFGLVGCTALYLAIARQPSIPDLLGIQTAAFTLFYLVFSSTPRLRWLIPASELQARVQEAAFAEFYASGLYRTRESNGVLIYLSCFEREVVVLGDRAIDQKMGSAGWNEVRDRIIQGIHEGRAKEGICAAVELCGRTLAQHFPYVSGDANELADQVLDRKMKPDAP